MIRCRKNSPLKLGQRAAAVLEWMLPDWTGILQMHRHPGLTKGGNSGEVSLIVFSGLVKSSLVRFVDWSQQGVVSLLAVSLFNVCPNVLHPTVLLNSSYSDKLILLYYTSGCVISYLWCIACIEYAKLQFRVLPKGCFKLLSEKKANARSVFLWQSVKRAARVLGPYCDCTFL